MYKSVFKYLLPLFLIIVSFSFFKSDFTLASEQATEFKELKALSVNIADSLIKINKKKTVVVDFITIEGKNTRVGNFLAEEFSINLASSGKGINVVDRPIFNLLIKKYKIPLINNSVDYEIAQEIGQIVSIDTIIAGSITILNDNIRLAIKVIDIKTANDLFVTSANIPIDNLLRELLIDNIPEEKPTPVIEDSTPTPSHSNLFQKTEINNFSFELVEAKKSGTTITMKLIVTSLKGDQRLTIYLASNRIFDSNGNEYGSKYIELGNKKSSGSNGVTATMIESTPTKLLMNFNNVDQDIKKINVLELTCSSERSFNFKFRNISL